MNAAATFPAIHVAKPTRNLHPWAPTLIALALTLVITACWAIKAWSELRLLRLPDNDDMMRLAQVRDWLGGQGFNDLMQYRLGPPEGASMHWSRFADLGPAGLILLFRPIFGPQGAELAMILSYPAILFFCYLLLIGRIARRLADGARSAAIPAMLLAAIAFPTISLFIPGRIDHHALQIVLMLVLLEMLVAPAGRLRGALGGLVVAISLHIGLEAAPEMIAVLVPMGILWIAGGAERDQQAIGFGAGLGVATILMLVLMHPHVWPGQWCDGFTPSSSRATLALAIAWVALGMAGGAATKPIARLGAAGLIGGAAAVAAWKLSPVCLGGPYGALDPFLQKVWMSNVSEAQDLIFGQDTIGTSIAYGGLCLMGTALAMYQATRRGLVHREMAAFAAFMALSMIAAVLQVRVTYILAGIAAIPFAVALARVNREEALPLRLALWVLGAGICYNVVGIRLDGFLAKTIEVARTDARACVQAEPILVSARYRPGTIVAPLDLGSYLVGLTPHHVLAAGYHRNNIGNMAMYRFFLAKPADAEALARRWGIDYVAFCADNLDEDALAPYRRGSFIEAMQKKQDAPAWLQRIETGGAMQFYRVLAAKDVTGTTAGRSGLSQGTRLH